MNKYKLVGNPPACPIATMSPTALAVLGMCTRASEWCRGVPLLYGLSRCGLWRRVPCAQDMRDENDGGRAHTSGPVSKAAAGSAFFM